MLPGDFQMTSYKSSLYHSVVLCSCHRSRCASKSAGHRDMSASFQEKGVFCYTIRKVMAQVATEPWETPDITRVICDITPSSIYHSLTITGQVIAYPSDKSMQD